MIEHLSFLVPETADPATSEHSVFDACLSAGSQSWSAAVKPGVQVIFFGWIVTGAEARGRCEIEPDPGQAPAGLLEDSSRHLMDSKKPQHSCLWAEAAPETAIGRDSRMGACCPH